MKSVALRLLARERGLFAGALIIGAAAISFTTESFAFPNSIVVCGSRKRSLSMPAKPGAIERFITTTLCALSTSRIGMP